MSLVYGPLRINMLCMTFLFGYTFCFIFLMTVIIAFVNINGKLLDLLQYTFGFIFVMTTTFTVLNINGELLGLTQLSSSL